MPLERGLIRFFYNRPVTDQILVTFGLALVVQEVMRWIFGGTNLPYATPPWATIPVNIGIGYYPPWRLVIVAVTLAVVVALFAFLRFTRFGLVVRAGMRDPEMLRYLNGLGIACSSCTTSRCTPASVPGGNPIRSESVSPPKRLSIAAFSSL